MATSTTYSPWLRFYLCPDCGMAAGKYELRYDRSVCPKCGSTTLTFPVGRWRIETPIFSFWRDFASFVGLAETDIGMSKWTAEIKGRKP